MKEVDIYTDGACSGNPGEGGWAAVLLYNGHKKEISGYVKETTNNRMEMFAVIQGLKELRQKCRVKLFSDSAYVVNAINNGWVYGWKQKGWRKTGGEVKNPDLWRAMLIELGKHEVTFIKVKGHSDNEFNNRCDELARGEIEKSRRALSE